METISFYYSINVYYTSMYTVFEKELITFKNVHLKAIFLHQEWLIKPTDFIHFDVKGVIRNRMFALAWNRITRRPKTFYGRTTLMYKYTCIII